MFRSHVQDHMTLCTKKPDLFEGQDITIACKACFKTTYNLDYERSYIRNLKISFSARNKFQIIKRINVCHVLSVEYAMEDSI